VQKKKSKYRPMKLKKRLRIWGSALRAWALNDTRSLRDRALLAASPVISLMFAFVIWGPVDTVVRNRDAVEISGRDVFFPLFVTFVIAALLLTGVFILLRGVFLDTAVCLIFWLLTAGYLQLVFFNRGIGLIDGEEFYFTTEQIITNNVIWILIALAVFGIRFINKNLWTKTLIFGSALLFVMQFASFAGTVPDIVRSESRKFASGHMLSLENEFLLSSNENTIVFVLDSAYVNRLDNAFDAFPYLYDVYKDFTYFKNASVSYCGTFPSISFMLTGQFYDFTRPTREYLGNIWSHPDTLEFYNALKDADYKFRLLGVPRWFTLYPEQLSGIADNFIEGNLGSINSARLITEMLNLSAFRHAPLMFKTGFMPNDGSFANLIEEHNMYVMDDIALYERLTETRLSAQNRHNMYVFYHMRGSHTGGGGVTMDEFASRNPNLESSDRYRQTAGALWIITEYIDQMMQLGIYDTSNIIITTDHGSGVGVAGAYMIKRAGEQRERMNISHAPAAQEDFLPTLIDLMGLNIEKSGLSVFDVTEDTERERVTQHWISYPGLPNSDTLTYNAVAVQTYTAHVTQDRRGLLSGGRRQTLGFSERFPDIPLFPVYDSFYGGGWER
jgi:hypothetical protein